MLTCCGCLLWPTACVFTLFCCLHILSHNGLHSVQYLRVYEAPESWSMLFWTVLLRNEYPHMPSSSRNWAIMQDPCPDKLNHQHSFDRLGDHLLFVRPSDYKVKEVMILFLQEHRASTAPQEKCIHRTTALHARTKPGERIEPQGSTNGGAWYQTGGCVKVRKDLNVTNG